MRPLPFHVTTGFADLVDRVHGAAFDERFPANGKFIKLSRGDRAYWYHTSYDPDRPSKQRSRYAGAVGDPAVDALVAAHSRLHADYKARKELASSMRQSGLPAPDGLVGELALKFQKVGLFQAGAVLVGFVAYQCYGGLLGARLDDGARHRTQNIALGQDRQVALAIAWGGQPPIDFEAILRQVDPSFRLDLNSMRSNAGSRRYQNDTQYSVDLLTADARPDRDGGSPSRRRTLKGERCNLSIAWPSSSKSLSGRYCCTARVPQSWRLTPRDTPSTRSSSPRSARFHARRRRKRRRI